MVAKIMEQSGDIIFANLALLFAVGVAIGLAGGDGVAGLAKIRRLLNYEQNDECVLRSR